MIIKSIRTIRSMAKNKIKMKTKSSKKRVTKITNSIKRSTKTMKMITINNIIVKWAKAKMSMVSKITKTLKTLKHYNRISKFEFI